MQGLYNSFFGYSTSTPNAPAINLLKEMSDIDRQAQKAIRQERRNKTASALEDLRNGKLADQNNYQTQRRSKEVNDKVNNLFKTFYEH